MQSKQNNKDYIVGMYVRLSRDDERAGESLSIENQKAILSDYIAEQGWTLYDTYVDDGISGTTFERPGVKRLLDDAKQAVLKQWLEDIVINATVKMLESTAAIHNVAQEIFNLHTKQVADNSALKLIEQKRKEAVKAQNNMIKAIEQGIITEATKSRLTELETLISQYDFDIAKEKARNYTFLTVEQIEMFLSRFVFENPSDMKVRKLIVNTFIREVILYPDRVVITYNFTDNPEHIKFTKEHVVKTEKEIETADKTVFSSLKGSYIYGSAAPFMQNTE